MWFCFVFCVVEHYIYKLGAPTPLMLWGYDLQYY